MTIRQSLLTVGAFATLGIATLGVVSSVSADSAKSDNLASKIAQKFNLNQEEVQKVVDEHKGEMHQGHQNKINTKLDDYISSGKISAEQKTIIMNKLDELHNERENNKESFKNLTQEERKSKMEEKKTEINSWAKQNGIDEELLKDIMPKGRHGHGPRM
jgi:hypothetical protein